MVLISTSAKHEKMGLEINLERALNAQSPLSKPYFSSLLLHSHLFRLMLLLPNLPPTLHPFSRTLSMFAHIILCLCFSYFLASAFFAIAFLCWFVFVLLLLFVLFVMSICHYYTLQFVAFPPFDSWTSLVFALSSTFTCDLSYACDCFWSVRVRRDATPTSASCWP